MCDIETNLDVHLLNVLETCLAVVLATIITRASDYISYRIDLWYFARTSNRELSDEEEEEAMA